jgi:hypothetical protein
MGAEALFRLNTSVASPYLDVQVTGKIIPAAGVYEIPHRCLPLVSQVTKALSRFHKLQFKSRIQMIMRYSIIQKFAWQAARFENA